MLLRMLPLLLLAGCDKPLDRKLYDEGYRNIVPLTRGDCDRGEWFDDGYTAERDGHRWQILKCCHTWNRIQVTPTGNGQMTTTVVPTTECRRVTRDLGEMEQ